MGHWWALSHTYGPFVRDHVGSPVETAAWGAYRERVELLRQALLTLPPGAPVRLRKGKRTSNLFRPRDAAHTALDAGGFAGVLSIDAEARTADVLGMTTYEHLVDATLPYGLMPLVVPQLKTITLGGAVTGLGIESSSFRNGCPHESVLEMDVLTGDGRVRHGRDPTASTATCSTASPTPTAPSATPSGCGSSWSRCTPYVHLRHVRFPDVDDLRRSDLSRGRDRRSHDGERVDFIDGDRFSARRVLPHAWRSWADTAPQASRLHRPADLLPLDPGTAARTGSRSTTTCGDGTPTGSGARGPSVPRTRGSAGCWPRAGAASRRLLEADRPRAQVRREAPDRRAAAAGRSGKNVIQDIEVPVDRLAEFVGVPRREHRDRAVLAVPAAAARPGRDVGPVPARPGDDVRQRRLLVDRRRWPRARPTATTTARSSARSTGSAAASRCTPRPSTRAEEFWDDLQRTGVRGAQEALRPATAGCSTCTPSACSADDRPSDRRRESQMPRKPDRRSSCRVGTRRPADRGSRPTTAAPPARPTPTIRVMLDSPARAVYLITAPSELGLARAYVTGDLDIDGSLYDTLELLWPRRGRALSLARTASSCCATSVRRRCARSPRRPRSTAPGG